MSANLFDVLVVGAGPVGLFCANELMRQGLHCRIIDKKAELSDKSKALALHIRTLDLLADCGFIAEVLIQGLKVEGIIVKSKAKELINASFAHLSANHHFLIDLPQDKTERILYQGLINKGINVNWQTELIEIAQTANAVTATVQHADGHSEKINASWLIACDGAHSTLRKLLYAKFTGLSINQTWWLADLHITWDLPENKMVVYLGDKGPLACFPIGEKRYRLVMSAPKKIEHKQPTLEDITQLFNLRSSDEAVLSNPNWISQFGIEQRQLEKYRYGRVFFAGDAAHVHSPVGGQGLNTGMQDIYNLAWKLALVHKGFAHEQLLDSYQKERQPIAHNVVKKTGAMTRLIMLTNPVLIGLRNRVMQLATSFDFIKNYLLKDIAELDISYAKSPIVNNLGRSTAFKIGEFLNDFPLIDVQSQAEKQLHQITRGTLHHLFLFDGFANSQLAMLTELAFIVEQRYRGLINTHLVLANPTDEVPQTGSVWIDNEQKVYKRFAIQHSTAVLIRPDKYIGLTQTPINQEELLRHLEKGYITMQQ